MWWTKTDQFGLVAARFTRSRRRCAALRTRRTTRAQWKVKTCTDKNLGAYVFTVYQALRSTISRRNYVLIGRIRPVHRESSWTESPVELQTRAIVLRTNYDCRSVGRSVDRGLLVGLRRAVLVHSCASNSAAV